jgi:acetyltransferase-like isoleucine patch superfamily enzyme
VEKLYWAHMSETNSTTAFTPNQKAYAGSNAFGKYITLVAGDYNPLLWIVMELYYLLVAPLPGILGLGLRGFILPILLSSTKSPKVEKSVVIRSPSRISLGSSAIIDQSVTLDGRNGSAIKMGARCFVGAYSLILAKGGDIIFADGVNVSSNCRIASEGKIEIGKSVLISAFCYIGPGNHNFSDTSKPIMEQGMEEGRGVIIGENSWIGAHSTILDGVKIGKNVVIGAHSLVKADVPDNAIVGGVPAKILKMRA